MEDPETNPARSMNTHRHFLNLYAMALADKSIDVRELELLYRIGLEKGIGKAEIDRFITNSESVDILVPESLELKAEYLYDLVRMAWADGRIDPEEERTLESFCRKFGFKEENISAITGFFIDQAQRDVPLIEVQRIVVENE